VLGIEPSRVSNLFCFCFRPVMDLRWQSFGCLCILSRKIMGGGPFGSKVHTLETGTGGSRSCSSALIMKECLTSSAVVSGQLRTYTGRCHLRSWEEVRLAVKGCTLKSGTGRTCPDTWYCASNSMHLVVLLYQVSCGLMPVDLWLPLAFLAASVCSMSRTIDRRC